MARVEELFGTDARIREKIGDEIQDKATQDVLYLILDRMQTLAERIAEQWQLGGYGMGR